MDTKERRATLTLDNVLKIYAPLNTHGKASESRNEKENLHFDLL